MSAPWHSLSSTIILLKIVPHHPKHKLQIELETKNDACCEIKPQKHNRFPIGRHSALGSSLI